MIYLVREEQERIFNGILESLYSYCPKSNIRSGKPLSDEKRKMAIRRAQAVINSAYSFCENEIFGEDLRQKMGKVVDEVSSFLSTEMIIERMQVQVS